MSGKTGTSGSTGADDLAPRRHGRLAAQDGQPACARTWPARRRHRPGREAWALVIDALLEGGAPVPSDADIAAAAAELGVTDRVVRGRLAETRRRAYRQLGDIEISADDLMAPTVAEAAARIGRPAWAVRLALGRVPGRAPLRLLNDTPHSTTGDCQSHTPKEASHA